MTIYYRGRDVLITHEVFQVLRPEPQSFPIWELHSVRVVEGARRRRLSALLLRFTPPVAAALVVTLPLVRASSQFIVVLVALAVASVVSVACLRDRTSVYVLMARHRNREVPLFHSTDAQTFWQVKRALQRVLERYDAA